MKTTTGDARVRPDGRRALLIYMQTDLIKDLKKAALDEDRNAYEIVEELVEKFLESRKARRQRSE